MLRNTMMMIESDGDGDDDIDDDDDDIDGEGDDDDDDKVVECHCFTAGGARKLHVVLVVHTLMQSSQESLIYCLYSPKNWQIPF